jgi:hypothetical protein
LGTHRLLSLIGLAGLALSSAAHAQTWRADNGNGTYTNPLFFDECSDPDMIRVGSDFYLTGTTMHSMPGLPVPLLPGSFTVVDRGLGRVALRAEDGFVSVDSDRAVSIRPDAPAQQETFQWIETFDWELTLLSLASNRYLRVDPANGRIVADSPGPRPGGQDGVRFHWRAR